MFAPAFGLLKGYFSAFPGAVPSRPAVRGFNHKD
jgi:hypothetical protein